MENIVDMDEFIDIADRLERLMIDLDSLGWVRFIIETERHYNIRFTDSEIVSAEFKTPEGLAAIIERKMA